MVPFFCSRDKKRIFIKKRLIVLRKKSSYIFFALLFLFCFFFNFPVSADSTDTTSSTVSADSTDSEDSTDTTNSTDTTDSQIKNGVSIIKIQSADKTTYGKDKVSDEEVIALSGNVVISVTSGDSTVEISADEVNFNRKSDMLYASGSVVLNQKDEDGTTENITADSLLFNTATLEGIFDDGRIVQAKTDTLNLPSGSTLIVASDIFGRDDSGTVAFKSGELTFCDNPNPYWRIKASRIWLLPGNEFAFFNALLYVGEVPLLYLPIFYYPKDELIFNPVFGLRTREGYFFQTTTYILGRKPLDTSSSDDDDDDTAAALYNFMKPTTLKDQQLEGLVLHNLDENYTGSTDNYLKIMGDWYANLGAMAGFEGQWKPGNAISKLSGGVKLGFSNTVFYNDGEYLPYSSAGIKYSDSSNFMGFELPFRYSADLYLSVSKPFSLTLSLPLYSDPYFTNDFEDRSETMDWINYLLSNPTTADSDDTGSVSTVSSFTWSLSASESAPIPDFLKPYISKFSISSITSSLVFSSVSASLTSDDNWSSYTPERKFYYPSQVIPVKVSISLSGTLLSFSSDMEKDSSSKPPSYEVPLAVPNSIKPDTPPDDNGKPKDKQPDDSGNSAAPPADNQPPEDNPPPADTAPGAEQKNDIGQPPDDSGSPAAPPADNPSPEDAASGEIPGSDEQNSLLPEDALPDLAFTVPDVSDIKLLDYSLTYKIAPYYTSQIVYSSSNISSVEEFSWKDMKSTMYTVKAPASFTSDLDYYGGLLNLNDSLAFDPVYQVHPYISDEYYTETSSDALKETDYEASSFDITNENTISGNPFYYTTHFKKTSISYSNSIKLLRTEFIGDADNPEWDYLTLDWTDEDSITEHSLDFTYCSEEDSGNYSQSLTLSTTLPPQVDEYYGTFELVFPYISFTAGTGVKQTSSTDTTWEKEDIKQSTSINLFSDKLKFTESYNYNWEDSHNKSLKLALSGYDLQLAYTMSYTTGYDFDSDDGWIERDTEEFLPYNASLAYSSGTKNFYYWKNRISFAPSLSTSIVADFLRPTNSYFKFQPAITFKINDFMDITFSSLSRNDVVYRYVQSALGDDDLIPGETNPLTDLVDSFRFDDDSLRKSSGFKLKSFSLTITHDLHDWDLNAEFKVSPRYISTSHSYDFSPYFSLSVIWRPMESMKTEIVDDYGTWELNPSDDDDDDD